MHSSAAGEEATEKVERADPSRAKSPLVMTKIKGA
jgi:hypothetical protein